MSADVLSHDRPPHGTSSIVLRSPLRWPNDARVAFAVVVSTEYYELQPAATQFHSGQRARRLWPRALPGRARIQPA